MRVQEIGSWICRRTVPPGSKRMRRSSSAARLRSCASLSQFMFADICMIVQRRQSYHVYAHEDHLHCLVCSLWFGTCRPSTSVSRIGKFFPRRILSARWFWTRNDGLVCVLQPRESTKRIFEWVPQSCLVSLAWLRALVPLSLVSALPQIASVENTCAVASSEPALVGRTFAGCCSACFWSVSPGTRMCYTSFDLKEISAHTGIFS